MAQSIDSIVLTRSVEFERQLGNLISQAVEGNITLQELYDAGENVNSGYAEKSADSYDCQLADLLLKDALEKIHLLHDAEAREYHKDKQELRKYAAWLLGESERVFRREITGESCKITYLPNSSDGIILVRIDKSA